MACGREAKGREVEDGRRQEWRERGAMVWVIGSTYSIKRKILFISYFFLLVHVGEAAKMAGVQSTRKVPS